MNEENIKKTLKGKNSELIVFENGHTRLGSDYYEVKVPRMDNLSFEVKLRSLLTPLALDDITHEYRFMKKFAEVLSEVKTKEERDALIKFLEDIQIGELGKMYSTSLMPIVKNHPIENEKNTEIEQEVVKEEEQEKNSNFDLRPYKHKLRVINMDYFTIMNTRTVDTKLCNSVIKRYQDVRDDLWLESLDEEDYEPILEMLNEIDKKIAKVQSKAGIKTEEKQQQNTSGVNLSPYMKRIEMIEMEYDEIMQQPGKDPEDFFVLAIKLKEVNDDLYDLLEKASPQDKDKINELIKKTDQKRINLISKGEKLEEIGNKIATI